MRSRTRFSRWTVPLGLAWLGLLWMQPAADEVELILTDGRVLHGTEVRREGVEYVLTLDSGAKIALPAQLVASVGLVGSTPPPEPEPPPARAPSGLRYAEAETIAGSPPPPGPSGIRHGEPEVLAGREVRPPSTREQLEVFGEPAQFQKSIIDPSWRPETDWNMDPETQNNFAPSKWAGDIVDSNWQPESAWDADEDVLEEGRSTWRKSIIDSSWTPTDGFKK